MRYFFNFNSDYICHLLRHNGKLVWQIPNFANLAGGRLIPGFSLDSYLDLSFSYDEPEEDKPRKRVDVEATMPT